MANLNSTIINGNLKVSRNINSKGKNIIDLIYPLGSIYITVNNIDPKYLFGGSWTRIEGRFLLGAGSEYSAGDTNSANHWNETITSNNLPEHSHSFSPSATVSATFSSTRKETDENDTDMSVNFSAIATNGPDPDTHYHKVSLRSGGYTSANHNRITASGSNNYALSEGRSVESSESGDHYHSITINGTISQHTHILTINGEVYDISYTPSTDYTSSVGQTSPQQLDITNPHINVYIWKRTA